MFGSVYPFFCYYEYIFNHNSFYFFIFVVLLQNTLFSRTRLHAYFIKKIEEECQKNGLHDATMGEPIIDALQLIYTQA